MNNSFVKKLLLTCKNKTVAISGHRSADFDCIGSCIAMHMILKQFNISSDIFVESNIDSKMLKNAYNLPILTEPKTSYDVCITVDCPSVSLIPENVVPVFSGAKTTFCIDHHISNSQYATYNYVDNVSSACEVIYTLFEKKIKLNEQLAKNLYLGIYTDTGGFKYSNTSSKTFEVLSKLTKINFHPDELIHNCVDLISASSFALTKCAFNSVKFYADNQIAVSLITKQDLDNNKVDRDTSKFMQGYLQNLEGVKVAVCVTERSKGEFNISLRTACDDVNVSDIASRFGGGGHVRASGLTLRGDFQKALNALIMEIKNQLKGD